MTERPLWVEPAASNEALTSGTPAKIVPALAVVPPMSNESTFCKPSARPRYAAPITPLAGPLSISVAGRREAVPSAAMPPSERMTKIGAWTPSARTPRATRSRYARTIGESAALTTVVEKRSYSRYCGSMSDDSETSTPGIAAVSASATACSWAGSTSACSSPTATAVMPRSRTAATAACTLSLSSSTRVVPSWVRRSRTTSRSSRRASGLGRVTLRS